MAHNEAVYDSTKYLQDISFTGFPLTLEIRSAHDPHVKFGQMTSGFYELDNSASGQIAAGVILLIFGAAMLLMSAYKTYRFCVKYTFPNWQRERRAKRYRDQS